MSELAGETILIGPSSFAALDTTPLDMLKTTGAEVIDNPYKRRLTKEEILELLSQDITGLLAGLEPLDEEVLRSSNLKVISRCGSGMSNVDLKSAKSLHIEVYNTPDGPTQAVAELVVGAMLSMLRMIPFMDAQLHQGNWAKQIGRQLDGKTVTIVGFGRIGTKVAQLLSAFNVNILAVDPYLEKGAVSLETALSKTDIITFHCSGEDKIMGAEEFDMLKEGAYILNAARGGIIDEQSLVEALESGKVAGAWIDTFVQEPYKGRLSDFKQVVLTPHVGSYTKECRLNMEMQASENLISAMKKLREQT